MFNPTLAVSLHRGIAILSDVARLLRWSGFNDGEEAVFDWHNALQGKSRTAHQLVVIRFRPLLASKMDQHFQIDEPMRIPDDLPWDNDFFNDQQSALLGNCLTANL